ncbi:60S acidic ribosomal protein P2-4 [Camellia lanceoleosa]|uniref:60S acidic ribosomal protein P2-4 n=1 Tax=Camellia lanceoleosa TaxID=1840588 RepID=A0ACC0G598_9ERIC|nr:60S acidic ribosomal protein P2-4 [Camellia lanceoleosa]
MSRSSCLLLSEVKGKDITELIASGREKLASVPSGGGGAIAVTSYGGGGLFALAALLKLSQFSLHLTWLSELQPVYWLTCLTLMDSN